MQLSNHIAALQCIELCIMDAGQELQFIFRLNIEFGKNVTSVAMV